MKAPLSCGVSRMGEASRSFKMNIIIVGCGKVGARLASVLDHEGHAVSIVDRNEENFELLSPDFGGFKTIGVPIDQDVLREAGIESCDALTALSQDDNVNIMVSQLALEIFQVPIVLARIYDPRREAIFSHFGIHTVCPTNLTVAAVRSAITEREKPQAINLGSHTINFSTVPMPKGFVGTLASDLISEPDSSLYAIQHKDFSITLYQGQKIRLQADDKLIISTLID